MTMRHHAILAAAALLAACGSASAVEHRRPDRASWSDSVLATLSVRQKAAQMVWPTVWGDYVASDAPQWERVRGWIETEGVGGFTMSVGSPLEIAAKLNAMQSMSAVPLLVGADLEFGAGYRARGGYFMPGGYELGGAVVFPPQMALGATRDTALAYRQGEITAREGRALGMHIVYAPILDVNNNPANPVINTRAYGADPALVAAMGAAFVRGVQSNGMIATGKHFPGHGDTGVNSHLALPVVTASRARLDSVELVPFRRAVEAGVGAIMSFHGAMPALDPSNDPGTLSRRVLTGVLRDELGFASMIISDAMDMRGVLDRYGAREAAMRAVAAGADVLIQPLDVAETISAVVEGVTAGRYDEARLDASVRRILRLKEQLGLHRGARVSLDSARTAVGRSEHQAAARELAERSITLVRDSAAVVPLREGARVVAVTFARRSDYLAGRAFDAELRTAFPRLRSEFIDADEPDARMPRVLSAARDADVVIIGSYVTHAWNATTVEAPRAFADLVGRAGAGGAKVLVVALGNPYLLQQIPEVPAYLVAWGGLPVSQQAAARAVLGRSPIGGRLPIPIPPVAPFGAGMDRRTATTGAR
ncbi:MAG TPA: glycoside hydrolase family 3 N-terminal domain-containing protein [Gemmatimonadaceae bacterium]|nr:glycoside hydrolase family 3 N-terminal domain-containing protein [Gemmatimonadaceae bacterium]